MATLKDVALKSGVTITTVSRVLNNKGYISDKTRKKVYEVMEELNYQPNEIARSLSKKRADIIGVIVPNIQHPFFAKVVDSIENYANQKNYKIMLCNSQHQEDKERDYVDILRSNKVSGIIVASRTMDIDNYLDLSMPVIFLERFSHVELPSISCDNKQGGVLATEHLIECGCKNLLHISGSVGMDLPADHRSSGFLQVCKERGVQHKISVTNEQAFFKIDYEEEVEMILKENPDVDGIFASSDIIAATVISVCRKFGKKIPEDIKLVGFDDIVFARLMTPKLTTIKQPIEQMCIYAVNSIIGKLEGEIIPTRMTLPVTLVKRETT